MLAQQIGEGCYEIDALRGTDTRFLDTEKMNPRIKSTCFDSKNLGYEIGSRFTSHGEAMLPLLIASRDFKKLVLIIDEPEAGISLKNQMKILEAFDVALENDCQVIVTTHSYVLIHEVDEVFDLDTRKWTTSRDYLEKTLQTIL
jgi:predicted ATPase